MERKEGFFVTFVLFFVSIMVWGRGKGNIRRRGGMRGKK